MIKFGSVCSGIEAASVAWNPLGWKAAWLSEIEPFPCAVLAHHYPDVPNLGDMTTFPARIASGEIEAPEVFCGGTPCQAFSVAGLRRSLDDARGNLSLTFCEIANAIDIVRADRGQHPTIVFWENVPGVLSTKDNAFGCLLAGLAGEDDPLVPPGGKWTNAGAVLGPKRAVAWRVLDAQYFGVAQRRRRVFVVASARDGFDPTAVLFEFDGLRRDIAPSREAGKIAPTIPSRSTAGGGLGTDFDCDGRVIQAFGGNNQSGPIDVATARNACASASASGRMDFETETFLVQSTHTLRAEGFDASEVGMGRGTPLVPVTMRESGQGYWMEDDIAGTLRAEGEDRPSRPSHVIGMPVPHCDTMPTIRAGAPNGGAGHGARSGDSKDEYIVPVAFPANLSGTQCASTENLSPALGAVNPTAVLTTMQIRRLTPVECERLQGFPDGYTAIPWRKKPASECPDGPRYKALGNSWAVPVVAWIGKRIDAAIKSTNRQN